MSMLVAHDVLPAGGWLRQALGSSRAREGSAAVHTVEKVLRARDATFVGADGTDMLLGFGSVEDEEDTLTQ